MEKFMFKRVIMGTVLLLTTPAFSTEKLTAKDQLLKIQAGSDYSRYSDRELRKRIWDLERAVDQLQQKINYMEPFLMDHHELQRDHFQMERRLKKLEETRGQNSAPNNSTIEEETYWLCTLKGKEEVFTSAHKQKAIASNNVMEQCKTRYKNSSFSISYYCPANITCSK